MKKFYTADRETGSHIEAFATYEEAQKAIEAYEDQDKQHGVYEENFFDIVDKNHCSIKIMYRWVELWDGGVAGEYFESFENCKQDAIKHVKGVRWTKREMEKEKDNLVMVDKCYLDGDGEEIDFDNVWSIEVNENTVDRVY